MEQNRGGVKSLFPDVKVEGWIMTPPEKEFYFIIDDFERGNIDIL